MKKSKVWFSPFREVPYNKLGELFRKAQMDKAIEEGDIVAIKLHFGELSNTHYIRPIFARRLVELVNEAGGKPFLTDTTTLYRGRRHTPLDYLESAKKNGFSHDTMGCPIIIADGFKNTGTLVKVKSPYKLKEVRVAQAIYEADVLISLAHFTLHPEFPVAATIKNIGMGGTTKEFKIKMHSTAERPSFNPDRCVLCKLCLRKCPGDAFKFEKGKIVFLSDLCLSCGDCVAWCKGGAIGVAWGGLAAREVQAGTIDAVKAIVSTFKPGKVQHINIALDITHFCDCAGSGETIVPDIGLFASSDPVALEKATYDLFTASPGYPGSILEEKGAMNPGDDKVRAIWPNLDADKYFELAYKSGLGNPEYELIHLPKASSRGW